MTKKHQIIFFLVFITSSLFFVINSRIADKRDLRGLYDAVIEKKKYLSPFHGFIWVESGLLEKYYVWGNATVELDANGVVEKIIKADNTMLCILNFFYRLPGQFGPTTTKTNPATYFTPEVIGKIVAAIDRTETLIEENPEKARGPMLEQEIQDILMGVFEPKMEAIRKELILLDQIPYIKKLQQNKKTKQFFNFTPKNWKNSMQKLSALPDKNIRQLFEERQDTEKELYRDKIISLVGDFKTAIEEEKSKKQSKALRLAVPKVSKMIVESLKECGFIPTNYEPIYPSYTTHMILLSLLYEKAKTKDDFMIYFKQFDPSILQENSEQLFEGKLDYRLNVEKNPDPEHQLYFINTHFEQIAYEAIYNLASSLPPKISFTDDPIFIKNIKFSNCTEIALMSFFRIIMAKIGAYNFETTLFDANAIPSKITKFFHEQHVPFNQDLMQKNIASLQEFFKKYSDATIVSDTKMSQALTDIFTNIPGIKYLQKIKNDLSSAAVRDNKIPVIHPVANTAYGEDFGPHELVDDSYTLFELAPYPSSYIAMVNHFFGTHITSFEELCTVFDCTGSGNLDTGNDKKIWEEFYRNNIHKTWFITIKTIINKIPITFTLSFSTRHNAIELLNEAGESPKKDESILIVILPHASELSMRNLSACYPRAKQGTEERIYLSNLSDDAYLPFFALSGNISKSLFYLLDKLISKNQFEPTKPLYSVTEKIVNMVVSKNDENLSVYFLTNFFDLKQLSTHTFALMHKFLSCITSDIQKENAYEKILKIIFKNNWEKFATNSEFITILDTINTWLSKQRIDMQQNIIFNVLKTFSPQAIPDTLIPIIKASINHGPLTQEYAGIISYIRVVDNTGTIFTEEEKEKIIQPFESKIFPEKSIWETAKNIVEQGLSFLFPFLIKKMNTAEPKGPIAFANDGIELLNELLNEDIIPGTPLYAITENVASKIFNIRYIRTHLNSKDIPSLLDYLTFLIGDIAVNQKTICYSFIEKFFLESSIFDDQESVDFLLFYATVVEQMLLFYNEAENIDELTLPFIKTCLTSFLTSCITQYNSSVAPKLQDILNIEIADPQLYECFKVLPNLIETQLQLYTEKINTLEKEDPDNPDLRRFFDRKNDLENDKQSILSAVKKITGE